jgi:hypothetical protein
LVFWVKKIFRYDSESPFFYFSFLLFSFLLILISQNCTKVEHAIIDLLMDEGAKELGKLPYNSVSSLYNKGLIYFDIPIQNNTIIIGMKCSFYSLRSFNI